LRIQEVTTLIGVGTPRRFIITGKKALKTLLTANKRLNMAYVLKESFVQLWSYEREGAPIRITQT
jgi:hypothetical protein